MGSSFVPEEWAEILRTKGIRYKGYGLIPKYAMQDPDLKIAAKGLYAFLCSIAGNETEAYPAVSTIKSYLKIGDKGYSTYMNALIETGYVSRETAYAEGHRFGKNIYRLSQQPKKFFSSPPPTPKGEEIRATIRADGLLGGGYGFITRMLTFDQRLDIKAKALYAYFAAFTGAGEVAFPSREQILRELDISKSLYYDCLNRLLELNYITIKREQIRTFERNRYVLNDCPDDSLGSQRIGSGIVDTSRKENGRACPNLACTGKGEVGGKTIEISTESSEFEDSISDGFRSKQGHEECPNSAGIDLACPETAGPVAAGTNPARPTPASTVKEGANKTTLPITTVPTNSFDKYQSYLSFPKDPLFNAIRQKTLQEIDRIDRLSREELLPALQDWFSLNREDFDRLDDPGRIEQAQTLLILMSDFLASKRPLNIKGNSICHEEVLTRFLQMDREDLLEVGERISQYIETDTVGNPLAYTLSAIYNQATVGRLGSNL